MAGARRASRRRYVLLIIVLTAVTLITLDTRSERSGPIGALGRAAHTVVSPIQGALSDVTEPVGDWFSGVFDAGDLRRDNRELRQRLGEIEGRQREGEEAIKENETLRGILAIPLLSSVPRVTGRIVGREPSNFDPTLEIDKGQESGIAVGMPVIAPAGVVGKVIETWRGGSKIQVLTDPQFAVGIQAPAHPPANATVDVASGQVGSRELIVDFPAGTKVEVGDRIVTSPVVSSLFPPDLLIGTISTVKEKPGGIGVTATIRPYVDIDALEFLTVLLWVQGDGPVVSTTTTTTTTTTLPGFFAPTTVAGA